MLKRELRGKYREMHVMADYCRSQEAHQLGLAENDPVESRRKMALVAAKAWGLEAIKADKREAKTMGSFEKPVVPVAYDLASAETA